ncbi:MAG: superoxide dismutase [Candidatus Moranbacteria bacterium RIFCSPHIGHO2_12_FULL_54_9]|nr:MAG: superoxide dismutase [Candidatus Moranbacteria bacterium RIFCSPHIGHO2_01_FULL_54_31]OGI24745.1 MAG: superoxide dismutase [Candidatus Moranbacteria bacterium RIFCSPHIGHO2_12_FULL_54_9]
MSAYAPKDYKHLLGLPGLSDTLLTDHFTLYEGYVANTNKSADRLAALAQAGETTTPEYAELKRRFGWEWNGMRLHEYYFDNLSKDASAPAEGGALLDQIIVDFGSREAWEKDFRASGAMRGIGWVVLAFDKETSRLFNTWVNEHDLGNLVGTAPLIVMDVFEHAYMLDYGIKRAEYIETFFRSLNWPVIEKRFENT